MSALAGAGHNLGHTAAVRSTGRFWIFLAAFAMAISVALAKLLLKLPTDQLSYWFQNLQFSVGPIENLRSAFANLDFGVTAGAKALVGGLAFGADSELDPLAVAHMKIAGLSHLTAVSGTNCAIVGAAVWLLTKQMVPSIRWQLATVAAALVGYLLLVGFEPSVLRATAMALVVVLARMSGRPNSTLGALTFAVSALLLVNPSFATDIGFALSALATFGILLVAPKIHDRFSKKLPNWLSLLISASVSAQLLTLPIIYSLQGSIPIYSLLANLIVEPMVVLVTVLGLLTLIFATVLPPLAAIVGWFASIPAFLILAVAQLVASFPAASFAWQGPFSLASLCALAVYLVAFAIPNYRRVKFFFAIAAALLAATLGTSAALAPKPWQQITNDWQLVQCDVGQGDALLVRSSSETMIIDAGNDWGKLKLCLDQASVSKIDHLVLTHFDLDHIGAVDELITYLPVEMIYVSAWPDKRWAATNLNRIAELNNIPVLSASAGSKIDFKNTQTTVLSPIGNQGEDSNDGSLVILITLPTLELLALADSGERAQMRLSEDLNFNDRSRPLIVKVAHHGSADQFFELYEELRPDVALISVGKNNSYGHPTDRTLGQLVQSAKQILRTDELGSIALSSSNSKLNISATG